jgi:hypothetical protein
MSSDQPTAGKAVAAPPFQPAANVLAGETADVYFERARRILAAEGLDPVVSMEIFGREEGILCGAEEALAYLRRSWAPASASTPRRRSSRSTTVTRSPARRW